MRMTGVKIMIVLFVLLRIDWAVPKCTFLDVVTMNGILFIVIMSTASVTSPWLLIIFPWVRIPMLYIHAQWVTLLFFL